MTYEQVSPEAPFLFLKLTLHLPSAHKIPPYGWLDSSQMRGSFYTPTYRPPEVFQLDLCQTSADVYAAGLLVSLHNSGSEVLVLISVDK